MSRILLALAIFCLSSVTQAQSLIDQIDSGLNDRTDILAIYEKGELVYEEYRHGYERRQKHKLWSVSKSITSLLVARAVQRGLIDLDDSICEYVSVANLTSANQCEVTVERILFWQSGTDWSEKYVGFEGGKSSVLTGLYGEGIDDFASYYFSLPYLKTVKNNWNYSTGDTNILSHILRSAYPAMEYDNLPWRDLFDPLGIQQATFERDRTGLYLGGAYIFLSHPSLYKIASFVMDEIRQPKLLPHGWMDFATSAKMNVTLTTDMIKDQEAPAIPAGHWWVNRPSNPNNQATPWPDAPEDTFAAFGVFGQMMFIIPSQDRVIIRLAQDIKGGFDKAHFLQVVFAYLEGKS